jgi:hypothetical protein
MRFPNLWILNISLLLLLSACGCSSSHVVFISGAMTNVEGMPECVSCLPNGIGGYSAERIHEGTWQLYDFGRFYVACLAPGVLTPPYQGVVFVADGLANTSSIHAVLQGYEAVGAIRAIETSNGRLYIVNTVLARTDVTVLLWQSGSSISVSAELGGEDHNGEKQQTRSKSVVAYSASGNVLFLIGFKPVPNETKKDLAKLEKQSGLSICILP